MIKVLKVSRIAQLDNFDDSQRKDVTDKACEQYANADISALEKLVDFVFDSNRHLISLQSQKRAQRLRPATHQSAQIGSITRL